VQRDAPGRRIHLLGENDSILGNLASFNIFEFHSAAIRYHCLRNTRQIVKSKLSHPFFELGDTGANKVLPGASCFIFGILAEISMSGGFLQVLGDTDMEFVVELL